MPALIASAILAKAIIIAVVVHFLAASASLLNQLVIVFVSSVTTGTFVLAAAVITARSHARMNAELVSNRTSIDDVKRKLGAAQRKDDTPPPPPVA